MAARDDMPAYQRQWRRKNYARYRKLQHKSLLKTQFGITPEDYDNMVAAQKGCCAICGRHQTEFRKLLAVDHDHETGKIRGLLCVSCNIRLGHLESNWREKAERYLERQI